MRAWAWAWMWAWAWGWGWAKARLEELQGPQWLPCRHARSEEKRDGDVLVLGLLGSRFPRLLAEPPAFLEAPDHGLQIAGARVRGAQRVVHGQGGPQLLSHRRPKDLLRPRSVATHRARVQERDDGVTVTQDVHALRRAAIARGRAAARVRAARRACS